MADDNGHLVPVFIIYADGARLGTEHEGAVRRIRVSDRLDGIGRCVIEFGHPAAALLERGAITPESAVDVHLGYKDDCGKVFGGEVTGLEYGYSEHGGECLRVTVSGRLHRLRNAVRSESYERKTAGGFVAEMLDRYGLKAEIEDFGPEAEVSVHHLESDWDFLIEHAKRYGRSVYEQDGTVYVKNEITVSQKDIVLEFGKSIISFRVKESLEGQISKCTYTGWNMMKAEGITGSAEVGEVSVKAGGGTSWADEARILPGMWESVIDSQGVRDAEDARNRALGELQNASMEWQRAEVRCEGDHRIRPGMRVTLKYVGERFSGEYVAERVEHEFGADGFITKVHLRRNMLPREPKRTSAIDEERERQHNGRENSNSGKESTEKNALVLIGGIQDESDSLATFEDEPQEEIKRLENNKEEELYEFGKISSSYRSWLQQDADWADEKLSDNVGDTIAKHGCKVVAAAKLICTIAHNSMFTPKRFVQEDDKIVDNNGNVSQIAIANAIKKANPSIPIKQDYFENQLNESTLKNLKKDSEYVHYILGRAEIGGGLGQHWVVIENYSVAPGGTIQYECVHSSANDFGRMFTSDPDVGKNKKKAFINKIEVYSIKRN